MSFIRSFFKNEDGAVTVDWVVLTAGVVVLAVAVGSVISGPVDNELAVIATVVETTN